MSPHLGDFKPHTYADYRPLWYGLPCCGNFWFLVFIWIGLIILCQHSNKGHIVDTFTIHVRPSRKLWTKRITRPIQYVYYRPFYILLLLLPIGYASYTLHWHSKYYSSMYTIFYKEYLYLLFKRDSHMYCKPLYLL